MDNAQYPQFKYALPIRSSIIFLHPRAFIDPYDLYISLLTLPNTSHLHRVRYARRSASVIFTRNEKKSH